ncbi:MAG: polysaccharide biosynthesis tyrosine autokinase [Planctomycetes bacterium]|nr:polysaccharide biosynthesis tyrosine autokinase [Planctomycetota bacterium]
MERWSDGRTAGHHVPTGAAAVPESLVSVIWRGRWIMLVCLVLALAAGMVYIQTATPIYTSTAKLYLDYGGIPIAQSYESGRIPRTDRYLYTQAELLVSRPILGTVFELPEIRRLRTFADIDVPMGYLRRNLHVEVGRRDEIVSVSFSSPYAAEVPQIVNRVVDAYMASRSDNQRKNSSQVLKMLQEEMARANAELEEKRDELEQFQSTSMPLALGSDQGSGVGQLYLTLQTEYTQAQLRASDAELFFRSAQVLANDPEALRQYARSRGQVAAYAAGGNEIAQLEAQLTSGQSDLEALLAELTPDHPRIASLTAQIERLKATITELNDRFVRVLLAAAERQFQEAKEREEELAELHREQGQKVAQLNRELNRYQRLDAEVLQLMTYCQTVEQQIREIRTIVGEDVGQLRMEILEPALVSELPSHPQKSKIMAMALILGLLAGGGLSVLRDFTDQTLRSGEEISAVLGLSVLGVVPAMSQRETVPSRGQKVHRQPDVPEAEAFRTIRTAIFFGAPKDRAKTLLVTSPAAGDGKSTLASNLAIAMAQAGQKTILLDADFRKPMQHTIFEAQNDHGGLSAVLAGQMKLGPAIQATSVKGLSLLSCGPRVANPSEILNSRRFTALLERLAEAYDRIVVDAPPVTAVADAQILGAVCDVTILVLRAGKSTRKIGHRAIDGLQRVGAHLLGAVVNDVARSGDRYGYYGTYGGSNGSGRGKAKAEKGRRTSSDRVGPKSVVTAISEGVR